MDPPVPSETIRSDPATKNEAFRLLSDKTRLQILLALSENGDTMVDAPMRFADLRQRITADDPGRINYHLNELTTHFVRRTEEGYELRESGKRIVRMVLSGTAIDDPVIEPSKVDMSCWYCDGQAALRYQEGWRYLECTSCNARCVATFSPGVISKNEFPPSGLLDRSLDEINDADRIWSAHRRASVMDEVCPECAGAMPVQSIDICGDHNPDWDSYRFCDACGSIFWMLVSHECEVCKYSWKLPTLFYPSNHPAVTAFYYDHGIEFDLAKHEQRSLLLDYKEELLSDDPIRIRITIPVAGNELQLTFDDRMKVINVTP